MTARLCLAIASILGGLSVAGGAFGAHALKEQLTEKALATFELGTRYQMYHSLALLLVGLLWLQLPNNSWLGSASWAFIVGIVIFSGSLYGLSLSGIKILGAITPLGGLALIIGWGLLATAALSLTN
ncbi:DUF423 domain-containing protein [Leptothoe spongobia]|uniref:DUF423 domain-containing protein n=1 Tax=Leptothoe spongobia TAU-MAC 1115 TaxID=1967444 RepID=A0A947DDD2_9CYAN|nr:DUF423 domain-containing protein [Leptothoe spongobia]MBT9314309.1 DUF423 domain-containing protein [Leptothoe spongobia TAU-MAC 1115]